MRKVRQVAILFAVATAVLGVAGGFFAWQNSARHVAEKASRETLRSLGAIVVMDAERQHVTTVNLSTVNDVTAWKAAIHALGSLAWLKSLTITHVKLGEEELRIIGRLASLESLNLTDCQIVPEATRYLSPLRQLQALYLVHTGVTNGCIPTLARLSNLRILDISQNDVTGQLSLLGRLTNLEWLLLRELQLTDDSLMHLATCTSLKRLSMEGTSCSDESLQKLQSQLPGAIVER